MCDGHILFETRIGGVQLRENRGTHAAIKQYLRYGEALPKLTVPAVDVFPRKTDEA